MNLYTTFDTSRKKGEQDLILANYYGGVGDAFLGFFKGFFGYPAILVGIFCLIGSIAQRKKGSEIFISTLKTIIGFLIISGGASVLSGTLGNLTNVIKHGFHMDGQVIIPSNEVMMGWMTKALPNVVTTASIILILAMFCNIILAKFSNLKYIYLTGHVLFYTCLAVSLAMYMAGLRPMENVEDTVICLISGGLFLGMYMILSPAASARYARKIVGNESLALGHTGGFGCAISGVIGQGILKISRKDALRNTENIKLPKKLQFLTNNLVSLSITMLAIYITVMMIALGVSGLGAFVDDNGKSLLGSDNISNNVGNAIVYSIVQALTFVAGIQIVIFGVKMFLEELVPAFSGIATKLIKGSKAAVEVQAFWPSAPNGVVIGFLSSFVGGLITFLILLSIHFSVDPETAKYFPIVLPELFPHLFIGGTAGVFANHKGGILGAILGPFIVGFVWAWFPVIYIALQASPSVGLTPGIGQSSGEKIPASAFAEVDHIIAIIPFLLIKWNKWIWLGFSVGLFLVPIISSQIKNRLSKNRSGQIGITTEDIKEQQLSKKEIEVS